MAITFELEGMDALRTAMQSANDELRNQLAVDVNHAGNEGLRAAYENHPYTDRTTNLSQSLHVEPAESVGENIEGELVAGEEYASFVNKKPAFNFMDKAVTVAQAELDKVTAENVDRYCAKLSGR